MSSDALLEEFLLYEKPRVSEQGYTSVSGRIRRVLAWFEAEDFDIVNLTIPKALEYQAYLSEYRDAEGKAYATGTLINYLKTARRFYDYLVRTERVASNPFRELRYPREPEHISRNVLSITQMGRLLTELARFDERPTWYERLRRYRVHVLAELLYASGLRIAEASSLTEAMLDLENHRIYLPEGKGGRARVAFLSTYAAGVLKHYLRTGRHLLTKNYVRHHGARLFGAHKAQVAHIANEELALVCVSLGIPIITTHGFRHSLGTHLLHHGCDMRHIQVILGHEALHTTQVYTRVDKDDLKRSIDTYHPRTWKAVQLGAPV